VKFGTTAGTGLVVNSATSITIISPAEAAATVDVFVTTPGGTSLANAPSDQFTFTAPPPGITAVGTFSASQGAGLTTLAVAPKNLGDVLVAYAQVGVTTLTLSSVSGGGVTTWTKGVQFGGTGFGGDTEIWFGKVTATGSSTVTFTWSGAIASHTPEYGVQEFNAGLGASTVWALDKSGTLNGASSTTVPFPSLTPSGSGELYFGYAGVANIASAGSSAGFTYSVTPQVNVATYDLSVAGAVAPSATQSPAGTESSIGVLLVASP
jgi:hypothetical protein